MIPRASKLVTLDRQKSAVDRSRKAAVGLVLSSLLAGGTYAAEPAEVFQRSGCVGMALVYATCPFTKFAPTEVITGFVDCNTAIANARLSRWWRKCGASRSILADKGFREKWCSNSRRHI